LKWLHLSIRQSTLVYLPNRVYIKTHQTKFSQSIILNPNQWQNANGFKKFSSFFYNQTSFIIDRKQNEGGNFELNPFNSHKKMYWGWVPVLETVCFTIEENKSIQSLTPI
jgi:hypothetical protein